MKMRLLQYLLALNVLFGFTNSLHAEQGYAVRINVSQPHIDSTQIPQALRDFIVRAFKEGLSIDQIVEQAVTLGYNKEQVISAYSVGMVQDDDATSIQDTLMWCALGAVVFGIGVGVGAWVRYTWFKPAAIKQSDRPGTGQNNGGPRAIVRDFHIAPPYEVANMNNERLNEIVDLGLFRGTNPEDIILQVRREFPNHAFEGHFAREDGRIVRFREERLIPEPLCG